MSERLALLERYAYWPHPPRGATREQVARFAFGSLTQATWTEVRSATRLEAAVARLHLAWDSEKLGVPGARIACIVPDDAACSPSAPIRAALADARTAGYGYLFTRVDAAELRTVQALEAAGFQTVDAIVSQYIRIPDAPPSFVPPAGVHIREATSDDADSLATITDASITMSRFHCDPWVGLERARALYREWARNSVRGLNDYTVVAEIDGGPVGFLTVRNVPGAKEAFGFGYGRIELVAVLEGHRGRGIVHAMTARLVADCPSKGWGLCGIGTQFSNVRAIRAYAKAGFAPGDAIFSMRWVQDAAEPRPSP
jgi:GNAT superfamily N-acetyltransferase